MRSFLTFLLLALFASTLVGLPRLPQKALENPTRDAIYQFVLGHRLQILVFVAVSNLFVATYPRIFVEPRKQRRAIRDAVMKAMRAELFKDEATELRITVFKKAGPVRSFFILCRVLMREAFHPKRREPDRIRIRLRQIAHYRFLRVEQRLGSQYPRSSTHFFYHLDTRDSCEGVAGQVMQTKSAITKRNLDPPSHEELLWLQQDGEVTPRVRTYMNETWANLRTLKRLNKRANHLHGEPLLDPRTSEQVGVLMIDSFQERSSFEGSKTPSRIKEYAKILNHAL